MKAEFKEPRDRICVALDMADPGAARGLAASLVDYVAYFKIGFELFTSAGPAAVTALQELGVKVFLDLKFHDIPNTVAGAVVAATRLGVSMLNVHASGGAEMMAASARAAADAAERERVERPVVLAVTMLTSLDTQILNSELRIPGTVEDQVVHLAKLAKAAGLDGVVASPLEVALVREACGPEFLIVTPGVRPSGAAAGDQRRVMTPGQAIHAGADILVIGRPIVASANPVDATKAIADEIARSM